jgi:CRISPR-associated protein Cas2
MKSVYIVSYDISDPKRWRRVFRVVKGFGDRIQYSVFRCVLDPEEHIRLVASLSRVIHHREDNVVIIDLGPRHGRGDKAIETLGMGIPPMVDGPIIL